MDFLTDPFLIDKKTFTGPVLVTGAGGCIGAWTCAILSRSGVPVIASDLTKSPARASMIMGTQAANALDWQELDVTDGASVADLVKSRGVQAVIHLAGLQVPFCAANPIMGARVNVEGTLNILEAVRHAGIRRTVLASSVAALSFSEDGSYKKTLYGAYKMANEQTAFVYWSDWNVPSICLRPNVVYGVARDQGMSSKNTSAIKAAVLGMAYDIPFSGAYSWLHAGEAASAFIAAVSRDGDGYHAFNLNGRCEPVEDGIALLDELSPGHQVTCSGSPFPFPPDLDDAPLRNHVVAYPDISVHDGVTSTYRAFTTLHAQGRLEAPE